MIKSQDKFLKSIEYQIFKSDVDNSSYENWLKE